MGTVCTVLPVVRDKVLDPSTDGSHSFRDSATVHVCRVLTLLLVSQAAKHNDVSGFYLVNPIRFLQFLGVDPTVKHYSSTTVT